MMKRALGIIIFVIGAIYISISSSKEIVEVKNEKIEFGEVMNFNEEEENLNAMMNFIEEIAFLNMEIDKEGLQFNLIRSNYINEEQRYQLYFNKLLDEETGIRFSMAVSNDGDTTTYKEAKENPSDKYTAKDGMTIYFVESESGFRVAYFECDDLFYKVSATMIDDDTLSWEDFARKIEGMGKENKVAQTVKAQLSENINKHFIMPQYFTNDMDLTNVHLTRDSLQMSYQKRHAASGNIKDVATSRITYVVSGKPHEVNKSEFKNNILANGREVDMAVAYEATRYNHQNVILFDEDDLYYSIITSNIEQPYNNTNPEHLKKIAESIRLKK